MENQITLGRYRIEEHLGSGTYADVYRAVDSILDRVVALKILKPQFVSSQAALIRFMQEAKVLANLQHEHIAWVWDLGEADGRNFLAMRYVDGDSLEKHILKNRNLEWEEALQIVEDIAEALEYAHSKGLVHRDIKPANIMLTADGRAVLTDFGLVKVIEGSLISDSVNPLGTLAYMAPEVLNGKSATPAADQFSLACVLVELLTGKGIFSAPTPQAVITKHFTPLELPVNWPSKAPADIEKTLRKALGLQPESRYASVTEFVKALDGWKPRHWIDGPEPDFDETVDALQILRQKISMLVSIRALSQGYKQTLDKYLDAYLLPDAIATYMQVGDEYCRQMRFKEALSVYKSLHDRYWDYPPVHVAMGHCHFHLGAYKEANMYYTLAEIKGSEDPQLYKNFGTLYMKSELYEKAIEKFRKALSLDPSDPALFEALENAVQTKATRHLK
jgi:serine/threonine protein kinase